MNQNPVSANQVVRLRDVYGLYGLCSLTEASTRTVRRWLEQGVDGPVAALLKGLLRELPKGELEVPEAVEMAVKKLSEVAVA